MTGRWERAGVRAAPSSTSERQERQRRAQQAHHAQEVRARSLAEARAAWERGTVRPYAITRALDARGLYGPEVDVACGGAEPMVDLWEAGELYPTWEQLLALAELTGFPVAFFARAMRTPDGPIFMCRGRGAGVFHPEPDVVAFTAEALARAGVATHLPEIHSTTTPQDLVALAEALSPTFEEPGRPAAVASAEEGDL